MNQIVVFYNPFLPELKISINGKQISTYSSLMSHQHQRLEKWCDSLFAELYREVNSDYEVLCVSNEFACEWLGELAKRNPHCISFSTRSLPLGSNVYDRLAKLELLGCDEQTDNIIIPIVNASGDTEMTSAVYEILEEQGVFEDITDNGIIWTDCPLTTIELQTCRSDDELPYDIPFVIALCSNEDDHIRINIDAPIYALVMGTETCFIRRQGNKLFFTVDPDDIGKVILDILEEEALSPLVSYLSYNFPMEAMALLTEAEREELALVCQSSPVCNVVIPQVLDIGRTAVLNAQILPSDSVVDLYIVSDRPEVLEVIEGVLHPHIPGSAEISVFVGDDPYPVATAIVRVRQRNLITSISLFPSTLCMPVVGSSQLRVTLFPDDAENSDEIRWESSDTAIAEVDPFTGIITANACGRCSITAYTQETSSSIMLEVQPEMEDIVCSCSFIELRAGEQKEWRYKVLPDNAYGSDTLRVISSDKNIAQYRGGYILGKNVGECKIYIKNQSGSLSRELFVTVKKGRLW